MSQEKVVLILVDGMRPDGLLACNHPYTEALLSESASCLTARTVMPSVTLPCHMSLFHSVTPDRHGILSNTYVPQVRPVEGLVERLDNAGKKCAFFYTWEELRDLSRPDHLHTSVCLNLHRQADTDRRITALAADYIESERPDFLFLYLGETDEVGGHAKGWMSETYLGCVHSAMDCVKTIADRLPEGYTLILLADHGGHDRSHGADIPEDMTIPLILRGPRFTPGSTIPEASILDVATTIAALLEVPPAREWEGRVIP